MTPAEALAATREVLVANGLPAGLLPDSLVDAEIDEASGTFEVQLPAEVRARFGGYTIAYATTISGRLQRGAVHDLRGVSAQRRPLWVRVRRITRDGDELEFAVGPVTRRLSASEFDI